MNINIVYYVCYIISWKTGNIITFEQFEEDNLVEKKRNVEEDESISYSIDELSTNDESDHGSISRKYLKYIKDGRQIHTYINTRYDRLRTGDGIKQKKR